MPEFDEACRQDVLQEASDELEGREGREPRVCRVFGII